jgi:hypothetical protein
MAQTLAEKLRILADAAEAGEATVSLSSYDISGSHPIGTGILYISKFDVISRIPKPKEQIQVGERWINAPLREMPKVGDIYWLCLSAGIMNEEVWCDSSFQTATFHNSHCWATKEDALAWHEASLALRKGGAV